MFGIVSVQGGARAWLWDWFELYLQCTWWDFKQGSDKIRFGHGSLKIVRVISRLEWEGLVWSYWVTQKNYEYMKHSWWLIGYRRVRGKNTRANPRFLNYATKSVKELNVLSEREQKDNTKKEEEEVGGEKFWHHNNRSFHDCYFL